MEQETQKTQSETGEDMIDTISQDTKNTTKKRWLILAIIAALLAVSGVIVWQQTNDASDTNRPSETQPQNTNTYTSEDYGFTFGYPDSLSVNERKESNRNYSYLGLETDFFISLKEPVDQEQSESIAFFYALPDGLSVEEFKGALENAASAGEVQATEEMQVNNLIITQIESSTQLGDTKTHYLFDVGGSTIIVSVFLRQGEVFKPVLDSLTSIQ